MGLTFFGVSITVRSGALIPLLLMIPNVVWMVLSRSDASKQVPTSLALTIVENAGRAAVLILPFFYSLDFGKVHSTLVMIGMGLALTVYYICWIRYFAGGRSAELLSSPLLGIPLPMALAPVTFIILSSYLTGSWWLLGASILFGIAHIWVSAITL
jgi:hypothetical protein